MESLGKSRESEVGNQKSEDRRKKTFQYDLHWEIKFILSKLLTSVFGLPDSFLNPLNKQ